MVFEKIDILENMSLENRLKMVVKPNRRKILMDSFRSAMMLNPLNLKHLNKIDSLEADVLIINLEDGIAPSKKYEALVNAMVFISNLKTSKSRIVVRTNELDMAKEEIKLLNEVKPDAIRVPKIKSVDEVREVLSLVSKDIDIHLSIETKEAFGNIVNLKIDERIKVFYLGILDLLTSLGLPHSILHVSNDTISYILSKFLIDCKIASVYPVSFVYQDYKNVEDFRTWCEFEKNLGFSAKGCIGPLQVEIAQSIFTIDSKLIEKAKYIKETYEQKLKEGIGGFLDERYGFLDEPIYKDAINLLNKI